MDNLEKQQHEEGTRGTTILKNLQLEGQKTKAKTQSKKLKNQKQHGKVFEEFRTSSTNNMSLEQKNAIEKKKTQTQAWSSKNMIEKNNKNAIWNSKNTTEKSNKNENLEQQELLLRA